MEGMISALKLQGRAYFHAIDMSLQTSQKGISIAEDAIELCGFLQSNTPHNQVLAFVGRMQAFARNAGEQAAQVGHEFSVIRRGILQVRR